MNIFILADTKTYAPDVRLDLDTLEFSGMDAIFKCRRTYFLSAVAISVAALTAPRTTLPNPTLVLSPRCTTTSFTIVATTLNNYANTFTT